MHELRQYKMWNNLNVVFKCVKCEVSTELVELKEYSTGIRCVILKCAECSNLLYIWIYARKQLNYIGELTKWFPKRKIKE